MQLYLGLCYSYTYLGYPGDLAETGLDCLKKAVYTMIPNLSIIIACSRHKAASECLKGLAVQTSKHQFEVIVIGDVKELHSEAHPFKLILIEEKNRHANRRRNIGLARAKGDIIAFLDDDTIPDPSWVEAIFNRIGPSDFKMLTGPERPIEEDPIRNLVYQVSRNFFSEACKAHVNEKEEKVVWRDVPFCNLVTTKTVLERVLPLSEEIPWDMDDFDLCWKIKDFVSFHNSPCLSIRHDRYPERILTFLRYKWQLRLRTGEKVISHPTTYLLIPTIMLIAIMPFFLIMVLYFNPWLFMQSLAVCALLYGLFLISQLGTAIRHTGCRALQYIWIMMNLQFFTIFGVWNGMATGLFKKLLGRL